MANNNSQNNELNDAVEQVETEEGSTSSQQGQQNQHNTAAAAAAAGAGAAGNAAAQEGQSANRNSESQEAESPSPEDAENGGAGGAVGRSGGAQSNAVQSELAEGSSRAPLSDMPANNGRAGAREANDANKPPPQNLRSGGPDAEDATPPNAPTSPSGPEAPNTLEGAEIADKDMTMRVGEEFDSASDDTTFDVSIEEQNDAPEVSQNVAFDVDEDGTITLTQDQLLEFATDVDGDDLTASNLTAASDATVKDNGDGTFIITPSPDFSGELVLSFDVSDGETSVEAGLNLTVNPINDAPVPTDKAFTVAEDETLIFTREELLNHAQDVDGDTVTLVDVFYEGDAGTLSVDHDTGLYTFTPNANFHGEVELGYSVTDGIETIDAIIDVSVTPVNDPLEISDGITATVDEDHTLIITQAELIANASDIDGDRLVASNLQTTDPDASVSPNGDGSYTITHSPNFNGSLAFTYDISDGTVTKGTTLDVTVNPVNDAPEAGDELNISATEDESVGVALRDDPMLRMDEAPEHGIVEAFIDDEWVELAVGQEIAADTEVRFVADENAIADSTHTTRIGTFDDRANLRDWGRKVDDHTREFVDGDLTVTTVSNDGPLGAWNGNTHIGHGIGDSDREGLSSGEKLIVSVDGMDINEISFHLDGLGGWFLPESRHFTEVEIRAFDDEGQLIDSLTYHKTDPDSYETDYTLTVDQPVAYFELGTVRGDGTYVVQNMTVSQTSPDSAVFTSIGVDGNELTETVNFDLREGDSAIDLTTLLPNITQNDAGAAPFEPVVISKAQLLGQASDVDNPLLSVEGLALVGDNADKATLTDNGNDTWTITPEPDFFGEVELEYQVSDGQLTDNNIVNIDFAAVNDAPQSDTVNLLSDEDESLLITQAMLLANASDIDTEIDALSAQNLHINPSFGELTDLGDGTWSFTPTTNFNGDVPFSFEVFDGELATAVEGTLTIDPINDAPIAPTLTVSGEEDNLLTIDPAYLLQQVSDVDLGDTLSITDVSVRAPGSANISLIDGLYHLTTGANFNGLVELTYTVFDGTEAVQGSLNVNVIPVNDAPFSTGNALMATNEDEAFTFDAFKLLDLFADVEQNPINVSQILLQDEDKGALQDNGDGTWTFTPSADFAGVTELQLVVSDGEFETALDIPLYIRPIADGAVVSSEHSGPLVFNEDEAGHLCLNVSLLDQSEVLTNLVITGFPVGFVVSDGTHTATINAVNQYIDVTQWNVTDLELTPPPNFAGDFALTVTTSTVDYGDEAQALDDGVDEGDFVAEFETALTLTADDLLSAAENLDAEASDAIRFVHLVDKSQGVLFDNGDNSWTFTPADDFTGQVDFAYVVDRDGVFYDEQSAIVVVDSASYTNVPPSVETQLTKNLDDNGALAFSDAELLATLSDADGDELMIESVTLTKGQGIIETAGDGSYQLIRAEGFDGELELGFIASDGEHQIVSHVEVINDLSTANGSSEEYTLAENGSLTLTSAQLLQELMLGPDDIVTDVTDTDDAGYFAVAPNDEWIYWPSEPFDGELNMLVEVEIDGQLESVPLTLDVQVDSFDAGGSETDQTIIEAQMAVSRSAQQGDAPFDDTDPDITGAPGDTVAIDLPESITDAETLSYVELDGLPIGSEVSNALDNGDGSYIVTGDFSAPLSVTFPDEYQGSGQIEMQGFNDADQPIDGALDNLDFAIDEQYAMQSTSQTNNGLPDPTLNQGDSGDDSGDSNGLADDSSRFDAEMQEGAEQSGGQNTEVDPSLM
ncbi:tandem-95 repeat protein [Vibrio sp. SM6]|uniref:Tandem-95 repeat protein n=1 Tax=Vibrio agarilyticus TaxID=2726741 RepID=A0A7X8TTA6_9VIBR|nr:tandem-95 repeat protein [Vibrio agarilyticus]NLS14421.1 tandem-95 repeat protein [Vibrio agarilyticus]